MNNNIDKKTLEELIQFHEQQIAANQRQIDELRGQFEPEPLPEVKPMFGQAVKLEDAKVTLYGNGTVTGADGNSRRFLEQGAYFISKKAAKLEAEKRRLRQLARVRMAESWGDERPVCGDQDYFKWDIRADGAIYRGNTMLLLNFRTEDHAKAFRDEVGAEGIKLIWEL